MSKVRVVAIDDVSDILDLIEYNLTKEGMEVHAFANSADALQYIQKSPPDIIVSDWMMPDPDGLEVCRRIRSNDLVRHIPIIMLTCKGSIHDYRLALQAGAQDYIVKPVRMDELIRRIKLLLPNGFQRYQYGA